VTERDTVYKDIAFGAGLVPDHRTL